MTQKGTSLSSETEAFVVKFYESDDMSRLMQGVRDCVSIQVNDKNVVIQKRLLLCNFNELFAEFQSQNENVKVGFSKFCELRPKSCV